MNIDPLVAAARKSLHSVSDELKKMETDYIDRSKFHGEGVPIQMVRRRVRLQRYRTALEDFINIMVDAQKELNNDAPPK